MKLEVPFIQQQSSMECGPINLKMVTAFLGGKVSLDDIKSAIDYNGEHAVYTIQLGKAASKLGYQADFYCSNLHNEHEDEEFYQENAVEADNQELIRNAERANVNIQEKELSLEDITERTTQDSIPIVLVDWNVIKNKEGYQGHFVTVTGYNEDSIIVHNSDESQENGAFLEIDRDLFDKARKAEGTDQDIVVIKSKD